MAEMQLNKKHEDYNERPTTPVRPGDELEITVEEFGDKGDPFGKVQNYVVFIHTNDILEKGTDYRVRITKVLKNFGFAEPTGTTE